jgi:hypothetical protein
VIPRRSTIERWAPPLYAVVDLLVIMAPSIALKLTADRGGMGETTGLDLVVTSLVIGLVHARLAGRRLLDEERMAVRPADVWIAAVDALVVLAVGATVLLIAVLHAFVDDHAALANRGYPVFVLWAGVQLVAVALAEGTARAVFWWLEPHEQRVQRRHLARTRRAAAHHGAPPDPAATLAGSRAERP